MSLNIGKSIRALRQERNVTQGELASAIGVTAQAVSKWERAEGYPEITLLPEIAAYFAVSLDTLCGLDEQRDQSESCRICSETMDAQSYDEGVRIAREGLAKYPYSYRMKENLALYRKMFAMYEIADERHNWPVGMIFSIQLYRMTAKLCLELGDLHGCLEALGKAADLALDADSLVFEGYPESLLLNRIGFEYLAGPQNDRAELLVELDGDSGFDSIRDLPEFTEIRSKLIG